MTTVNDTINIALGLQDKGNSVSAKEKDFDKLDKTVNKNLASIKLLSKELEKLGKAGAIVESVINSNINTAKARGGLSAGTPRSAANNAYTQGSINTARGADLATQARIINNNETIGAQIKRSIANYEIQQLSLTRQRKLSDDIVQLKKQEAAQGSRLVQIQAQIILRQEQGKLVTKKLLADLATEQNLYTAIGQKLANIQAATKQRLKDEKEIARLAAQPVKATVAPRTDAEIRSRKEQLLLGDGGASLFKVQAGLLVNYAVMSQIFSLFQFGTQYVVEFDKELKNLQAVTATTNTEMQGLSQTFVEVSQNTKYSAVELAKAAVTLGQAGLSANDIKDSIQAVALLATASGSDLGTSTDVVTSALTVFNLTATETEHVANIMTSALNLSKLTMEKLQLGIQYAGNAAAEAGLTLEELTAALGAMSNAGIKSGSTLGTGLTQLIVELQNPTKKLVTELSRVGLTLADVDVKSKGLVGVLDTLKRAGFSSAQAFRALDLRGARAYIALERNLDTARRLEVQFQLTSAATEANKIQMESLSNSAAKLRNTFGAIILQVGEPLKKALIGVVNGLSSVLSQLSQLGIVLPVIGTLMLSIFGAAVIVRIGTLASNLLGLTGLFTTLATATTAATTATAAFNVVTGTSAVRAVGLGATIARLSAGFIAFASTGIGAVAIGLTALIGSILAYNGLTNDSAEKTDKLRAEIDNLNASYKTSQDKVTSVDSEVERLLNRYDTLSNSQSALQTEIVSMNSKFGNLTDKLKFSTIKTVEDLIRVLRELKSELASAGVKDLSNAVDQGVNLRVSQVQQKLRDFKNSQLQVQNYAPGGGVTKTNVFGSNDSIYEKALGSLTSGLRTGATPEEIQSNTTKLNKLYEPIQTRFAELNKQQAELLEKEKNASTSLGREKLKAINKEIDFIQKTVKPEFDAKVTENFQVYESSRQVAALQLSNNDKFKALEKEQLQFQTDYSKAKKSNNKKELKRLEELAKKKDEYFNSPQGFLEQQNIAKESGLAANDYTQAFFNDKVGSVYAEIASNAALTADNIDAGQKGLGDAVAKAQSRYLTEITKKQDISLGEIQLALQKATLAADTRIAQLDATISQISDKQRGGLRGLYSDAEVRLLEDERRGVESQKISDDLEARKASQPIYEQLLVLAEKEKKAVLGSKASYEDKKKAVDNYNEAAKAQIENQLKIQELTTLEAARNGTLTESHFSLGQQIQTNIDKYIEQMKIQDDLGLNIDKNLNETFDNARSSFKNFVKDFVSGNQTAGDSFRAFASSVIEKMLDMATTSATNSLFEGILGFAKQGIGAILGGSDNTGGPLLQGALDPYLNSGGYIRAAAGTAINTRDSKRVMVRPGEYVLRNSAVDMIGKGNLDAINAMGNRKISESAGRMTPIASAPQPAPVNVYVVSPEAKPTLTKNDVLVTIQDDIARGGNTSKLIKQISR